MDFRVKGEGETDIRSFVSPAGVRLAKAIAVIGANASGKTNLLKPLVFLHYFLVNAFKNAGDDGILFRAHALLLSEKSTIKVQFEVQGVIYRYELEMTEDRVLKESLHEKTSSYFSYRFIKTLVPDVNQDVEEDITGNYELKQNKFGINIKDESWKKTNASLITIASLYESPLAKSIVNLFEEFNSNIVSTFGRHRNLDSSLLVAMKFFKESDNYLSKLKSMAMEMDFGFSGLSFRYGKIVNSDSGKEEDVPLLFMQHSHGDDEFNLFLLQESSGTQSVIMLLRHIIPSLENGGMSVIDEFESDLHPALFQPILDLFLREKHNPNNAQTIFTTHRPEVLNLLGKSQVYLVEKEGVFSEAWRLDDMSGVRKDISLSGQYMAGAFGAIPRVEL